MSFRIYRIWLFILFSVTSGQSLAADPLDPETIERPPLALGVGEQRLLFLPGLTRFSLGSGVVRAFSSSRDHLLLKGIAPGTTDFWVWKKDGKTEHRQIQIEKTLADPLSPALQKALSQLEETEILFTGQGVILRGLLQSEREAGRCAAIARSFPKAVTDETVLSDALLEDGRKNLQAWLQKSRFADRLRLETRSQTLWVLGDIDQETEISELEHRLRSIFPAVKTQIDVLPDHAPTVHFKVFLLELRKNRFHNMGLTWPAMQEGAFRVTTSGIQDALSLDLTLQMLEGDGSAKILSSPELVVRAPGEAELFSGGELPIQLQSHFYSNVTWKSFGLTLKLNVTHSVGERVRLDIMTEVSHLDRTLSDGKVPGLQANRMKTQVDARYGVPLLLSGLLQRETRENAKGLPFLRDIPILGKLFGSEDYLNDRSELVAVLLPSHAPPQAPMERFARLTPLGTVPPARNFIRPTEEKALRASEDFPWNVLR